MILEHVHSRDDHNFIASAFILGCFDQFIHVCSVLFRNIEDCWFPSNSSHPFHWLPELIWNVFAKITEDISWRLKIDRTVDSICDVAFYWTKNRPLWDFLCISWDECECLCQCFGLSNLCNHFLSDLAKIWDYAVIHWFQTNDYISCAGFYDVDRLGRTNLFHFNFCKTFDPFNERFLLFCYKS